MNTSKSMQNIEADLTRIDPGTIDEPHIHVVAAIIWNPDRSRFLIGQRQKGKHLADYWEFPGGKVEMNEAPEFALQRELKEEIDIEISDATPFLKVYHRYSEKNVLLDCWEVDEYEGDVKACEQQQLRWIEMGQIEQFDFPAADIPILEKLKRTAG
ncbi:MAG: (deoxy)nucleoside triphosphate pyrophosphohydrolase [Pseudomonadota bacterium]